MGPSNCVLCGLWRALPLFYVQQGDDYLPLCHWCVEIDYRNLARSWGPWEIQLSGDTWLVKVRR